MSTSDYVWQGQVRRLVGTWSDGAPAYELGKPLNEIKYNGQTYVPRDKRVVLFLSTGKLYRPENLLPENRHYRVDESKRQKSKGVCKVCRKHVTFDLKLLEIDKFQPVAGQRSAKSVYHAQFYVNTCSNCGDTEPYEMDKEKWEKLFGKTVAFPKPNSNVLKFKEVLEKEILVKKS